MRAGDLFDKIDIYSVSRTITNFGDVTLERTIWKEGIRCKVTHLGTPSVGGSEFSDDNQEVGGQVELGAAYSFTCLLQNPWRTQTTACGQGLLS